MNKKLRVILLAIVALITVLLVTSCGDDSAYALYDEEGYQVSVKYDANGGTFTVGSSVIVDTYGLNSLPTKDGQKIAKLISPNDDIRGDGNKFTPGKKGYAFVGWYASRTEVSGGNGEPVYTYADMWDFENDRLEIDPSKEYTAAEPVLTLYAAWVPQEYAFEFYSIDNPTELLAEYSGLSPFTEIDMPKWDEGNGKINMYKFPKIANRTFEAVYTDAEGQNKLTGDTIKHSGGVNYENATVVNPVMKLYIESVEGEWEHIFSVKQLKDISLDGNYVIENDLDLEGKVRNWDSAFVSEKFTGKLIGKVKENGEPVKIKNLKFNQASGAAVFSVGMFGQIGEGAVLQNISFEDVTMVMDKGAPMRNDVAFGLLSGTVSDDAVIENVSISGVINIDTKCYFSGQYSIGLVCGVGSLRDIDYSNIKCEATGKNKEDLVIEIEDGMVSLDFSKLEQQ